MSSFEYLDFGANPSTFVRDQVRESVDRVAGEIERGIDDGIRQKLIDAGWRPPLAEALKAGAAREPQDHQIREAVNELVRIARADALHPCASLREQIRSVVLPLVGRMPSKPEAS